MSEWLQAIGVPSNVIYYEKGTDALIIHEGVKTLVKIPRLDANYNPEHEAIVLRELKLRDPQSPSPWLYSYSPFHVRMERVTCPPIEHVIKNRPLDEHTLCNILKALFKLDTLGVDHGELRRPYKHTRVCPSGRVVFIDFGRASLRRRPSNLTSFASFMLTSIENFEQEIGQRLAENKDQIMRLLRNYKRSPQEVFGTFLEVLDCIE